MTKKKASKNGINYFVDLNAFNLVIESPIGCMLIYLFIFKYSF